jgi:PhnB protein
MPADSTAGIARIDHRRAKERPMQLIPYLNFNGQCEAAFKLYEKTLGGKIQAMMRHGDSPIAGEVPASWHDSILHAYMTVGDAVLMGSDAPPDQYQKPGSNYVSIMIDDPVEAERIFNTLAENGTVQMPFEQTFWAARFGMCVDQFGTPWMINCNPTPCD